MLFLVWEENWTENNFNVKYKLGKRDNIQNSSQVYCNIALSESFESGLREQKFCSYLSVRNIITTRHMRVSVYGSIYMPILSARNILAASTPLL
jgi:hypothetical protein